MAGHRILGLASSLVFLVPAVAAAQEDMSAEMEPQRAMYELPALTIVAPGESPLDQQAAELYEAGNWADAAQLYYDAAEGMPRNDADSYRAYDMAGRLYFYSRDYGNARRSMERAAEVAEATGDIVSAALRHVDAAFIAVWEGYPASRRDHVARAKEHAAKSEFGEKDAKKLDALIQGVEALPVSEQDADEQ